ncbi:MAG: glycosyltransferase family 1 protein, partial [Elusimicrobia bacterium]|nr:glycosyltransferase family 1 protein [Elusimicrobiota bacterium]
VIASDIPTHREVCKDGVAYVNPNDSAQIAETIQNVVEDTALRDSLKKKGWEQSKNYSWIKTAQETLKIFQLAFHASA